VATDGIAGVHMETHNWGKAAKFYQALGFEVDFATDHVVTPFEDTHYGTREMTVRDPDGRVWSLQAPAKD
jgi:hypothetical protein